MPNYKVTFLFNQEERGFSETYYRTGPNSQDAMTKAIALGTTRADKMAKDIDFRAIRVQDEAEFGDSDIYVESRGFPKNTLSGDITAAGVLIRVQAGSTFRRSLVLRGLPDDYFLRNAVTGDLEPTPNCKNYVETYGDALRTGGWQLRVTMEDGATPAPADIVSLSRLADNKGVTMVECASALEYSAGDECVIRGCRGKARSLNGNRVIVSNGAVGKVAVKWPFGRIERFDTDEIAGASIKGLDYDYVQISGVRLIDVRTRQTGRAFFQPAGKSKSRL